MATSGIICIVLSSGQLPPGTLLRRHYEHNYIYDEEMRDFSQQINDTPCKTLRLKTREYRMLRTVRQNYRLNVMHEPYFEFVRDLKKGAEVRSVNNTSIGGPVEDIYIDDNGYMEVPVRRSPALTLCHWRELRSSKNSGSSSSQLDLQMYTSKSQVDMDVVNSQPQSSAISKSGVIYQPFCFMFRPTDATKHLENACLGDKIRITVDGKVFKGLFCWIGVNIRENTWLVGVEVSSKDHIEIEEPTDGTFQGQRLWFQFQQDAGCYLLPANTVALPFSHKCSRFLKLCWRAINCCSHADINIELNGNDFTLGQHVQVASPPRQYLACVVWTGQLDEKNYVVVKLALPGVQWTSKYSDYYSPDEITQHKKVTGFYGDLFVMLPSEVRPLPHQLPIHHVEEVDSHHLLGKYVEVLVPARNGNQYPMGCVRWAGRITPNDNILLGVEMDMEQRPPADELVLAAVLHSLKRRSYTNCMSPKFNEDNYLWILNREQVVKPPLKESPQRVVERLLPNHIKPHGLEEGKRMKVTFGDDSEMIFGVVQWTGLVDGEWRVALGTMEDLPPHWMQYSEGAAELNMPPKRTLVVDPGYVSVILQKDERRMSGTAVRGPTQKSTSPSKQPPRIGLFNGIPYDRQFFEQLLPVNPFEAGLQFGLNYLIQVEFEGRKGVRAGVCRFVGLHKMEKAYFVGVELTHKTSEGGTNGTFPDVGGVKLFECPDKFGVLVAAGATHPVDLPIPVRPNSPFFSLLASLPRLVPPVVKVWCGVPHSPEFISTLRVAERRPEDMDFDVGFLVEVQLPDTHFPPSGQCHWIGWDATGTACFVGVELDQPMECEAVTDGQFCGRRLFQCSDRHGVLLPCLRVKLHRNIVQERANTVKRIHALDDRLKGQTVLIHQDKALPCDFMDQKYVVGFEGERGIQGRHNSCYMDTTLFSMFALNDSFDEMLCRSENESKTMQLLREAIVNPLRRDWFVSQANVMAFREEFEEEGKTQGMKTEQKDPEEFMQILFEKISKFPPFLKYKSNEKSHMLQLFFSLDFPVPVLSVEKMLELSFRDMGGDPWTEMPQNLIMLIPRDGNQFSGFKAVKHNLSLNVAPYLTADAKGRGKCNFKSDCSDPESFSCSRCLFLLCENHAKESTGTHLCPKCNIPLNSLFSLELYAVLCIEISHFVAFLRVPPSSRGQSGQWLFFDSMSDRHGDINVPLVKRLEGNTDQWLEGFQGIQDLHNVSPYLKRLATNPYVLFYRDARRRDVDPLVPSKRRRLS